MSLLVKFLNNELDFILFFSFFFILFLVLFYFYLFSNLDKKCDVTSYITAITHDKGVTPITVTQSCDIEKDIQGSEIDNVI